MGQKITIALKRGASCVGCDIAVVNFNEELFTLLSVADLVFSPTLLDVKYEDLKKMPDKSITIGFYHGAVRNSDNEELAHIMRAKCQIPACAVPEAVRLPGSFRIAAAISAGDFHGDVARTMIAAASWLRSATGRKSCHEILVSLGRQ